MEKTDADILRVKSAMLGWPFSYRFSMAFLGSFLAEREFTPLTPRPLI